MTVSPRWRIMALGLALIVVMHPGVLADRLHLESGGTIDVSAWWMEEDWLYYEGDGGTVGLPRKNVTRIERIDPSGDKQTGQPSDARPINGATEFQQQLRQANQEELATLIQQGNEALERMDYETAASRFREVLATEHRLTAASVGYAVSEVAMGHAGIAQSIVLDGLALDNESSSLHELLGDLRNSDERVEDALRSWKQAFALSANDRLSGKIEKAERELTAGRHYNFSSTSHFNVRYDGAVDRSLSSEVMDYLEDTYWKFSTTFRHAPLQPITVLLYPSQEFRDVTQAPEWVGGLYDGKIRVPMGGLKRLNGQAEALLSHELAHAFIHSKTRGAAPRWLHEGLAQIFEGRYLSRADQQQVAGMLAEGSPESWVSRGFSYPAALSLARYLEERRQLSGVVWLLEQLGQGKTLDAAMQRIYGFNYSGICARWAAEISGATN